MPERNIEPHLYPGYQALWLELTALLIAGITLLVPAERTALDRQDRLCRRCAGQAAGAAAQIARLFFRPLARHD